MAILDNRTLLSGFETGDTVVQPDDLSGATGGTADTEIFIQGARSWGYYSGSTRDGLLYDAGSAQDWSDQTFYLWVNCGVAGLLDTKVNGGLRVRFCGATVTDFFSVDVAGSDDYPKAVSGGWVMLVVDIEKAKTASHGSGGTPPATTAVRYVGIETQTPTMPRMADNTWLDAIWRLPTATPGILVEGQNTGSVDWTWDDVVSAAEAGSWGTAKTGTGGAVDINTPIRFGANDAVTHGFSDTNKTILWEDWDVATIFYGLEVIGGSGVQSFELGIKTGTLDAATGAQGCVIQAASAGERWYFDCDGANVDACNLYGCSLIHADDLQLDAAVSVISSLFIDCTSAAVSNAEILRCSIINSNTADSVAFMTTDDIGDIVFSTFEFSDGHGIELLSGGPASQSSKGNLFSGFGGTAGSNLVAGPSGSTDAAVSNNAGAARTITITDAGDSPSVRNESGTPSTTVVAGAVTSLVNVKDDVGANLSNARVRIEALDGTGDLPYNETVTITRVSAIATVAHTAHGLSDGDKVIIRGSAQSEYNGIRTVSNSTTNDYEVPVSGTPVTPATGTIKATGVVLEGLTDGSGLISASRVFSVDQNVKGVIRKSTSSPYFKTSDINNVVDSANGLTLTVTLILDE